jgi:hypothetical protein
MDKALVLSSNLDLMTLGDVMVKSGFFQDSNQAAQAVVKILAGQELGIGPIASMTGINVIKGRVTLSANLIAAAIKRTGRYNYRVRKQDNDGCEIEFFEGGQSIGVSSFTKQDAQAAGLLAGDNWRKYPRNMYFARAISNGAKWFCPDVFSGPVYTPDEMGAEIDPESGEVIEYPAQPEPEPEPKKTKGKLSRPMTPEQIKQAVVKKANGKRNPITDDQLDYVASSLSKACGGDDKKRHTVTKYLLGKESLKDLTTGEASALIDWIGAKAETDYEPNPDSVKEIELIIRQFQVEAGQAEMFPAQTGGAAYAE